MEDEIWTISVPAVSRNAAVKTNTARLGFLVTTNAQTHAKKNSCAIACFET